MGSQFPTPQARHACISLCLGQRGIPDYVLPASGLSPRVQSGWQWSTNQPRSGRHPVQGLCVTQMLMRSLCLVCMKMWLCLQTPIVLLLMIGWFFNMSNWPCWKHGHSLSKWSNVSFSSLQNLQCLGNKMKNNKGDVFPTESVGNANLYINNFTSTYLYPTLCW